MCSKMGGRLDSLSCVQGSYTAPNRGWLAPSEIGDVYGTWPRGMAERATLRADVGLQSAYIGAGCGSRRYLETGVRHLDG